MAYSSQRAPKPPRRRSHRELPSCSPEPGGGPGKELPPSSKTEQENSRQPGRRANTRSQLHFRAKVRSRHIRKTWPDHVDSRASKTNLEPVGGQSSHSAKQLQQLHGAHSGRFRNTDVRPCAEQCSGSRCSFPPLTSRAGWKSSASAAPKETKERLPR